MYKIQNNAFSDVTAYVYLLLVGVDKNNNTYYTMRLANNTDTANCITGDSTGTTNNQVPTIPCVYPGSGTRCSTKDGKFTCAEFLATGYWFVNPQTIGQGPLRSVVFTNTISNQILGVSENTRDLFLGVEAGATDLKLLWDLLFVNDSF